MIDTTSINPECTDTDIPQISVIIPCYRQAHFLGDAIDSVLAQNYSRVEIIVVDDGSPDNTAAVAARYPTVNCLHQENRGLAAARNAGIGESSGDYLVFLDADDRLLPDALATGSRCLAAHPDCAFASGHYRTINADGTPRNEYQQATILDDRYLAFLHGNYIGMHATVVYRRAALLKAGGFDTGLAACEDYDMYLRIARCTPVCRHDRLVAEYRQHDVNMSGDARRMLSAALAALSAQWQHVRNDPARVSAYRQGIRFWRNHYRTVLWDALSFSVRRRRWRAASRAAVQLALYLPAWVKALLAEIQTAEPVP